MIEFLVRREATRRQDGRGSQEASKAGERKLPAGGRGVL